jgi:hypothetical protein
MQYPNELFFLIVAITLWGLAVGGKSLISLKEIIQPEGYWFLALICSASAFTCFASASFLYIGLLTPANTFLIAGYIYLASYFRSLSQPLSKQFKYLVLLAILLFGFAFQYLMQNGTFVQRVSLVVVLTDLALIWQLIELLRLHKLHIKLPVFVIVTIVAEIVLATIRLSMLFYFDPPSTIHLYQEPFLTALVRWIWFTFTVLSYVAVAGYKVQAISADSVKTLLENNLLKLEQADKKAEKSELQLLASLNALAKARDNETGSHIIRTQNYVKALALRLRANGHYAETISDQFIDLLFKAAPLHDIGKIGIPDNILLKNGALTDQEWEIMKTHTLIGESVLSASDFDRESDQDVIAKAIKIAGGHHEKWDGTGYPRGLAGQAIPLVARIMALADMYDALVSERVYKKAWTSEQATKEIISKRGTHFDPLVVDAFIAEQDAFRLIADKYQDS